MQTSRKIRREDRRKKSRSIRAFRRKAIFDVRECRVRRSRAPKTIIPAATVCVCIGVFCLATLSMMSKPTRPIRFGLTSELNFTRHTRLVRPMTNASFVVFAENRHTFATKHRSQSLSCAHIHDAGQLKQNKTEQNRRIFDDRQKCTRHQSKIYTNNNPPTTQQIH